MGNQGMMNQLAAVQLLSPTSDAPHPPPPSLGRNLQTSLSCKSLPSCSYRSRCSSKVRFLNIWKKTQVEPWLYTVPGLEDGLGRNEEGGLRYLVQDHLDGEALEDDE